MTFREECQKPLDRYVSSYREGDAKGCAAIYAQHAEMYSPFGPPAVGRQAIEDTHAEWVAEGAENKTIEVVIAERSGDLGWCLAKFGEGTTGEGISLNILARQSDGGWLITRSSLNELSL
ncbi:Ketosteroid isomerase homolog [Roseivivax lentus]|uniref:Ketosteroid isomerase homolog n=1 Tax=Roseivivax lentus TaxID=633194 RepID=A0A1N7PSJ2_9RHOB|nr:ketosteroid isomerase family protein [Roseivivax lentus]SIT13532.1 Ketosteroid isomerase homolog [Roseivivax lentus]